MTDQEIKLLSTITGIVLNEGVTFLVQYMKAIAKSKELAEEQKEAILEMIISKVKEVEALKFNSPK